MRRATLALSAFLGAILIGISSVSTGSALVDEDEPWPSPTGDPHGPDGIYGPTVPAPEDRLRPGDTVAGLTSRDVPPSGTGEFEVLQGAEPAPDPDAATVHTVGIEVEQNLDVDTERFGEFVLNTLNDERGWPAELDVSFARAGADADADLMVLLATPATVDELCDPLPTAGEYSCATLADGAVLNALRWTEGAETFAEAGASLTDYRRYLVNHEVGHLLGYGHVSCPGEGEPAPVMVQQSISLDGCEPNGWIVSN